MFTRELTRGLKPVLERATEEIRKLSGANFVVIYTYDPQKPLFFERNLVVANGVADDWSFDDKPKLKGLAAVVRSIGELVVHDVDNGKIDKIASEGLAQLELSEIQLLDRVTSAHFVNRNQIKGFVGISLKAGLSEQTDASQAETTEPRELGILYVDFAQPHHFTAQELDLIRIQAHQVGAAILSAQFLADEQRLRVQADALREVSQAISSEKGLEEIAQVVLKQLGKVVDYRKASFPTC